MTIAKGDVATFDLLWSEIEAEAAPLIERDDIVRALLRILFHYAAKRWRLPS